MGAGEVTDPRVVIHPHREGEAGIHREHPVPTSKQRIDHIPRRAKHKEIAGIRHEISPVAQEEHRARILPTPGPQQAAPRLHELDRLFTKGVGQLDLDIADKTVVSQTVGGEQHSVIVHERTVLEVASGIPRIGLQ